MASDEKLAANRPEGPCSGGLFSRCSHCSRWLSFGRDYAVSLWLSPLGVHQASWECRLIFLIQLGKCSAIISSDSFCPCVPLFGLPLCGWCPWCPCPFLPSFYSPLTRQSSPLTCVHGHSSARSDLLVIFSFGCYCFQPWNVQLVPLDNLCLFVSILYVVRRRVALWTGFKWRLRSLSPVSLAPGLPQGWLPLTGVSPLCVAHTFSPCMLCTQLVEIGHFS